MKYSGLIWLVLTAAVWGFHGQGTTVDNVEYLFPKQLVVGIEHRFAGEVFKDLDNILGMQQGATVQTYAKLGLPGRQVISLSKSSHYDQFAAGYKFSVTDAEAGPWKLATAHIAQQFHHNQENQFAVLSNAIIGYDWKGLALLSNWMYNSYFESTQIGLAAHIPFLKKSQLLLEWASPVKDYHSQSTVSLGLKWMTFGHNFVGFISNQNEVGSWPRLSGAESQSYYFGFTLERIFDL